MRGVTTGDTEGIAALGACEVSQRHHEQRAHLGIQLGAALAEGAQLSSGHVRKEQLQNTTKISTKSNRKQLKLGYLNRLRMQRRAHFEINLKFDETLTIGPGLERPVVGQVVKQRRLERLHANHTRRV